MTRHHERYPGVNHRMSCMEIWGGMQRVDARVSTPGIDAYVISEPDQSAERGGDIHFLSLCGEGKLTRVILADVAGHGQMAAGLAAKVRDLMRRNINTLDQSAMTRDLNAELVALQMDGRFATAVITSYYLPINRVISCNAGHPRPLWYQARDCSWEFLDAGNSMLETSVADLPLGLISDTEYHQLAIPGAPGDLVVLYTDSLIEAHTTSGPNLSEAGLLELVRHLNPFDPARLGHAILDAVAAFREGEAAGDDVTVVTLHQVLASQAT